MYGNLQIVFCTRGVCSKPEVMHISLKVTCLHETKMAASIKSEPKSEPFESVSYGEGRTDPELGQCEPRHSDPVSLEDSIMALCVTSQEGVTDEMIVREYPNIDSGKRLKALQRLLSTVPPPLLCVHASCCFRV